MWLPISDQVPNIRQTGGDLTFRNHFAVYADSFAKCDEVRGGKKSGSIVSCATDRIDHRADGPFAVCAGDVDDARTRKIDMQFGDQSADIFQPEFDAEALKALEPGARLLVIDRRASRRANPRGLARRSHSAPAGSIHDTEEK